MPYNGMTPHMSGTTLSGQAREASVWFGWLAKVEDDVVHVRALFGAGEVSILERKHEIESGWPGQVDWPRTDCRHFRAWPTMRATMSLGPPAANETIQCTGREG
jgi:hypothetical protein